MDDPSKEPETPLREQLVVFAQELGDLYRAERHHTNELQRALTEIEATHEATIKTLATLVGSRDRSSSGNGHLERVRRLAMDVTEALDPELARTPSLGAGYLLHDIGVIGIPETILAKDGPLTDEEWEQMRRHPQLGAELVEPMVFLGEATDVIVHHHERFDGTGYPSGLAGDAIPLTARIFAVVDAFDAMTSDRPYRDAMPGGRAVEELSRCRGTQFDPGVVEAFVGVIRG